jgi:hypothetical protein
MRFVMDPTVSVQQVFCANLGRGATETLAMNRQALGEDSMSHKRVFERHAGFRTDIKKARQTMNSSWQAKQ